MEIKKVTMIPAKKSVETKSLSSIVKKRKVCSYARVSTDKEEQQSSYTAQVDYYTNLIKSHIDVCSITDHTTPTAMLSAAPLHCGEGFVSPTLFQGSFCRFTALFQTTFQSYNTLFQGSFQENFAFFIQQTQEQFLLH